MSADNEFWFENNLLGMATLTSFQLLTILFTYNLAFLLLNVEALHVKTLSKNCIYANNFCFPHTKKNGTSSNNSI